MFGAQACLTGLLLATLASFVVYLPLTALALNGGRPITTEDQVPALRLPRTGIAACAVDADGLGRGGTGPVAPPGRIAESVKLQSSAIWLILDLPVEE